MSGTCPTSQPVLPVVTQDPTTYKANIDGAINALSRTGWAFAPYAQPTPNMTVEVSAGAILAGSTLTEIAAQSTGAITAPVSNPRIDRVVVDRATGAVSVITGTPASSPSAPAVPAGKMRIAQVLLQTTSTSITNAMITDERVLMPWDALGPADNSLRLTSAGLQACEPVTSVSTAQSVHLANHGANYVDTAAVAFTLDKASTLFNGFFFSVYAQTGAATVTPNAADQINGAAAGASYTVPAGSSVLFVCDGSGAWWPLFVGGSSGGGKAFAQGIINGALQVWQRGTSFTGIAGGSTKTIFLTATGAGSWTVPADWNNANNSIICIGGGGGAGNGNGSTAAGGGGGGAFASRSNLTLSGSISYSVGIGGPGGSGSGGNGTAGGDTWFNSASMPASGTSTAVGAKGGGAGGGGGGVGGSGGASANSCGSTVNSGGASQSGTAGGGSGGGAAAGAQGAGGAGGQGASGNQASGGGGGCGGGGSGTGGYAGTAGSGTTGGPGGNNSANAGGGAASTAGTVGGGGGGATTGGVGGDGGPGPADYTATAGGTAGAGGGGGGGSNAGHGGAGGLYGGGGGGGGNGASCQGGVGGQGIIIIQYTSLAGATYTADGWFAEAVGGNATVSRVAGSNGFTYGLKMQRPNGNTATGVHQVGHVIASIDCAKFQGQSVELSFWALAGANFSAASSNLAVKLYTGTGTDEGSVSMETGAWTGSVAQVSTNQAITTSLVQYSFVCTIPANATEIGVLVGWTPVGTAGADDSFTIEGMCLKPASAGLGSPFDFPAYDVDLEACRTRCVVAAAYVPATTAQNLRAMHMRATPSVSGGGTGFSSSGTTKDALIGYQTTGAVQTLTISADL